MNVSCTTSSLAARRRKTSVTMEEFDEAYEDEPGQLEQEEESLGEAILGEIAGVREPGGVALDHPDAGTSIAARGDLLDATVVEPDAGVALVLRIDLGEVGSRADRSGQHPFQDILLDHPVQPMGCVTTGALRSYGVRSRLR